MGVSFLGDPLLVWLFLKKETTRKHQETNHFCGPPILRTNHGPDMAIPGPTILRKTNTQMFSGKNTHMARYMAILDMAILVGLGVFG